MKQNHIPIICTHMSFTILPKICVLPTPKFVVVACSYLIKSFFFAVCLTIEISITLGYLKFMYLSKRIDQNKS